MRSVSRTLGSFRHRAAATSVVLAVVGSGAALADPDPTATVEIEVAAEPRTITVGSGPEPLEITAFTGGVLAGASGNPEAFTSITFSNPDGNGNAMIRVSRDSTDLGGLQLFATMQGAVGQPYEISPAANWTGMETEEQTIAHTITATSSFGSSVRWTLGTNSSGDSGAPRTVSTTFTFTILDDVAEPDDSP